MKYLLAVVAIAVSTTAFAQQSPSQIALQIDSVINQWAVTLEAQQKRIADLEKELADLKAKTPAEKPK